MPKILIYEQFHPLLRLIKPMRNNGIDKKNPAMAHVLVMDAFFRYLVVLKKKYIYNPPPLTVISYEILEMCKS